MLWPVPAEHFTGGGVPSELPGPLYRHHGDGDAVVDQRDEVIHLKLTITIEVGVVRGIYNELSRKCN